MEVLELSGVKSVRVFNAYNRLMLGYKMLPLHFDKTYEQFLEWFSKLSDEDKRKIIKQAVAFVDLDPEDILAITSFVRDTDGLLFTSSKLTKIPLKDLMNVIVEVCMAIDKLSVFF